MSKLNEFLDLGNYYASNGGYLEKKSNAYLDDFKANAGYNNYTKFARDVNSFGQPGCQGQPWCAEYQFWKLCKILGVSEALKIMGGGFYNCASVRNYAREKGTWHKSPKKGALVIFRNGAHIGDVQSFTTRLVNTNEGNTSSAAGVVANGGAVRNKSYSINDSAIDGYVWIDWDKYDKKAEKFVSTGVLMSTVDDLYVRESPNGYVLGKINKGNLVDTNGEKSGKWIKVKVAGIGIGWCWSSYLTDSKTKEPDFTDGTIKNKQDKTERLFVGEINKNIVYIRTWAGEEYPTLKKVPYLKKTNLVDVMNYTQKDSKGKDWYYIRIYDKYYGFAPASLIKKR